MKKSKKRVIPGFGLTMGVTITMLSIVVLIPLASLVIYSSQLGFNEFIEVITRKRILSSFYVSFITALGASFVNAVMGLILAWVLVRYEFPGKRIMDGMIELPFALPTAVAGISLTSLTSDQGLIGSFFAKFGIKIAYTKLGITFALIFVGIPFVARAVQPVLEKLDGSYEEAARVMGAKPAYIFRRVILPELLPPLLTGTGLAFGRCLGEYGSVVFIAGNRPYETEITPLIIMSELQEFDYKSATSIALVSDESDAGTQFKKTERRQCVMGKKKESKLVKYLLIGISILFLFVMLVLPLFVVVTEALKKGWQVYVEAVTDSFTIAALMLTLKATVIAVLCNTVLGLCAAWAVTRFQFKGKKFLTTLIDVPVTVSPIIAGLIYLLVFGKQSILYPYLQKANIQIVFAVPGIILATVFVTFPFVFRELLPVLESIGTDEEEAAALMGAKGWTIFSKITFPHIKWALLYGIVLCTARAMGEFGAVSVLSGHLRGLTNTLPLHVEILFNEFQYVPAFAVSSILVIMAIILLVIRSIMEYKGKKEEEA